MATVTTELTDSFLPLATGQCFVQPTGTIFYGFGVSSPTVWHVFKASPSVENLTINYNGDYGTMWFKKAYSNNQVSVTITVV